jgi:metal-sulfur cluster biosynthetic enzyme
MNIKTNDEQQCFPALNSLMEVYDPEIGLNVVDLGLINEINFLEADKMIRVEMTLTTEFCPMGESITDDVRQTLSDLFTGYFVEVNLVFDPPWTPEMMTAEGKTFLGR